MNNLLRYIPLGVIILGLLFCQRDESPEHSPGLELQMITHERTRAPRLDKRIQFGIQQKRMSRLNRSANDDRNP